MDYKRWRKLVIDIWMYRGVDINGDYIFLFVKIQLMLRCKGEGGLQ